MTLLPALLPLLLGAGYETESLNIRLHGVENVTATGSTSARSLKDRFAEVINVKDYGATGDGICDDTAAIQAAIDAWTGATSYTAAPRVPSKALYLPSGIYRITAPLRFRSVESCRVYGDGNRTVFYVDGSSLEAAVDLNGTAYCSFENFAIRGSGTGSVTRAMWLRWTGVYRSSTRNNFRDITVFDLAYTRAGVEIGDAGHPGVQVDNTTWTNVVVEGRRDPGSGDAVNWQNGFLVGDGVFGNNLLHTFVGCKSHHHANGILASASNVTWLGGTLQSNDVDFYSGGTSVLTVKGLRSELSQRLLMTGGPATYAATVSIDDIAFMPDYIPTADQGLIVWRVGGSLSIRELNIPSHNPAPKIIFDNPAPAVLHIDGMVSKQPLSSLISSTGAGGVRVNVAGYVQATDPDGESTVASTSVHWDGNTMSFFGATPISKPTIGGARDDGTALGYVISQLAALGLVTDATVATASLEPPHISTTATAFADAYWDGVQIKTTAAGGTWTASGATIPMVTTRPRGAGPFTSSNPNSYSWSGAAPAGDFTCTVVFTPTSGAYDSLLSADVYSTSGWLLSLDAGGTNARAAWFTPSIVEASAAITNGAVNVVSFGVNGTTGYLRTNRNATVTATIAGYVSPTAPILIGRANGVAGAYHTVIHEVRCESTTPTDAALTALNNATLTAYGL